MPDIIHILPYLTIGALLGASLNYFHFGFSSSFSGLILTKDTRGMRSVVVMLGFAILLFSPMLAIETWGAKSFQGYIRPISLSIPIGAFLFGIGMQMGCGCASGTLNRLGQLQPLPIITLVFMIVGGTVAAATFDTWQWLPKIEPIAFQRSFGWPLGLVIHLTILIALYKGLQKYEMKHTGNVNYLIKLTPEEFKLHPILMAGLSLAILNASLLFFTGLPWSISSVFPFWGGNIIELLALPIDWSFWDYTLENEKRMNAHLLENPVSLTSLGVILGAFIISATQSIHLNKPSIKPLLFSILAGLLMGFGAVMASGCNIGAFFSGIASGSLHGWVWFIFAFTGNFLALKVGKNNN